jgi:hypothetical protein
MADERHNLVSRRGQSLLDHDFDQVQKLAVRPSVIKQVSFKETGGPVYDRMSSAG